jgi:hypothetical protein
MANLPVDVTFNVNRVGLQLFASAVNHVIVCSSGYPTRPAVK